MKSIFKQCGHCQKTWHSREAFVKDRELILVGFQAFFHDADEGLFLFNHAVAGCGTTVAVKAGEFKDLSPSAQHPDTVPAQVLCPGNCLRPGDLESCSVACELHWVREVLQILKHRKIPRQIGVVTTSPLRRSA
jgi:hypothetical protein